MSNSLKWTDVCEPEKSVSLDAATACTPVSAASISPIDNFYTYVAAVVPLGTDAELRNNDALGKVLLLGIVSAVEHYFRSVLSGLIYSCPLTRKRAALLAVPFGAFEYYSQQDIGLALFEHLSLADSDEVKKQTQKLLGFPITQDSSVAAAFDEYSKLCQLRHAAVHSRGDLGHKNLQELGIKAPSGRLGIRVELSVLHSSAAICQNVARAYNRLLYKKTVESWLAGRVVSGTWKQDKERFSAIFNLFRSRIDDRGYSTAYLAYRGLLPVMTAALTKSSQGGSKN